MSTKEITLENHVSTLVNACAFSLHEIDNDGENIYNVIINLMIDSNDENVDFDLPLISEIYHPTMSGALFAAYRSAAAFTDHFYTEVHVFNEAGECIATLNLDDVLKAIKEEIEAAREEVPEGVTIH